MIANALLVIKEKLNAQLMVSSNSESAEPSEELAVLLDGEKMDPISFKSGALSILLVNIEEEKDMRTPDRYRKTKNDGSLMRQMPEIYLNLYVLIIANFKQYDKSLKYLSDTIKFFLTNRIIDRSNTPELDNDIDHLFLELVTLPFGEQNEIWSSLKTTYHPSVIYRVKMLAFRDEALKPSVETRSKNLGISRKE